MANDMYMYIGAYIKLPKEDLTKKIDSEATEYQCCGHSYPNLEMLRDLEGTYCRFCGKLIVKHKIRKTTLLNFANSINEEFIEVLLNIDSDFIYITKKGDDYWEDLTYSIPESRQIMYDDIEDSINELRDIVYSKTNLKEDLEAFTSGLFQLRDDNFEFGILTC